MGWYSNFESMAIKTVLRRLLSKWGELSIENNDITLLDEAPMVSSAQQRDEEFAEAREIVNVDTTEVGVEASEAANVPNEEGKPKSESFELK